MSDALSIAVTGLNNAVSRTTQSARDIVNASSTPQKGGGNIDTGLVDIKQDSVNYAANAAVIKAVEKERKALLDITV